MSPEPARGALLLLVVLLAPTVGAQGTPEAQKPDLFPDSILVWATGEDEETRLCVQVSNFARGVDIYRGEVTPGNAGPYTVQLNVWRVVEGGRILQHADYNRSAAGLTYGSTQQLCWAYPLSAGNYETNVVVDVDDEVDEERENNNVRPRNEAFRVAGLPHPDLTIREFSISPREAGEGQKQVFSLRVANDGAATSPVTQLEVTDSNGVIDRVTVPAIPSRRSVTVGFYVEAELRPVGADVARARVDPDNLVVEEDETNNDAHANFVILPHPSPDLIVRDGVLNGTLQPRRSLRLDVVLENIGNRSAPGPDVRLFVDDVPIANASRTFLREGRNETITFYFVLGAGNHTLRVTADPDRRITELNDQNNDWWTNVTIGGTGDPTAKSNLVIARVDVAPDDPEPGEPVIVTALVQNAGDKRSKDVALALHVGNAEVGRSRMKPLDADRFTTVRVSWHPGATGPFTLRLTIDADQEDAEAYEDDNTFTRFVTILPPPAKLDPADATNETEPPANETAPPPDAVVPPPSDSTQPPVDAEAPRVEATQLTIGSREVPGGVRGTLIVSLRNPTLTPLPRMTVVFKIDGELAKEVLVNSISAAGTGIASSGEIDLPAGNHIVTAEVRFVGTTENAATLEKEYDAVAGEKGIPGASVPLVLVGVLALALLMRRR